jgi:hypothetical protein
MKPLRICALALALLGAGAWDSALPVTLPAIALLIFGFTYVLSGWTTRRRVTRLTRRLASVSRIDRELSFAEPGFEEMARTLTDLVQDATRQETWQVTANANEALPSAEIISLDRYRKGTGGGFDIPTQLPEAVEMQRRLVDRVANLRSRRHVLVGHAVALDGDSEDQR